MTFFECSVSGKSNEDAKGIGSPCPVGIALRARLEKPGPRSGFARLCAFVLGVLFTGLVTASPINLDMRGVGVVELAEAVIKSVLKRDYVITPDAAASQAKLTLSVTGIDPEKMLTVLSDVLGSAGVRVRDSGGLLYVEKAGEPEKLLPAAPVAVNPVTGQQFSPYGFGQFGQPQQNQLSYYQNGQAPKVVEFHRPKGKSIEFLATVAKLAGAYVPDNKGKGDVLVYGGDAETVARAKNLLEKVDTEPYSVEVKAALVEFTTGESSTKSLSLALSLFAGKLGAVYQAGSAFTNAVTIKSSGLSAALGLIDGDRRFKYVAEPSLRVLDGEEAKFTVGSEVPVRSSAIKDQGGSPVQSIEYRTAGVVVTVKPKILENSINVILGQQVSSFALTTTSGIDSPTILKREAATTVNVQDGELIMVAGMDETTENASKSGGFSFPSFSWGRDEQKSRSQLLLLLEVKKVPRPI